MYKLFIIAVTVSLLLINACTTPSSNGTEVGNERFTARIIDSDGKPVSGATVTILPVDYIPNATALAKTALAAMRKTTGDRGIFSAEDLDEGCYNIYAEKDDLAGYGDSVYITSSGIDIDEIVVDEKGSVTGYVRVQPNHDPQIVEVQILGTHLYTNVDSDGKYSFPEIALGTYLLRGVASKDGYIPTYLEVNTDPPSTSEEYPNLITMLYTGIPIVENITAEFSYETQLVALGWDATSYRDFYEYVIFRDREGTTQPATEPLAVTTETTFIDSTATRNNSSAAPFRYRVAIRDNSMQLGPTYGFSQAEVPYYDLTAHFSTAADSVLPGDEIEVYLMATSSPTAIRNILFLIGKDTLFEKTFTENDSVFEYDDNPITITAPDVSDTSWFILESSVENFDGFTVYDSLRMHYTSNSGSQSENTADSELTANLSSNIDTVSPNEEIEVYLTATSSSSAIKNIQFTAGNDTLVQKIFTEDDNVSEYNDNPVIITVPESDSSWFILGCSIENFDGLTTNTTLQFLYRYEDSDPAPAPPLQKTVDVPEETSFNMDGPIRNRAAYLLLERNRELQYLTESTIHSLEHYRIIFDSKQKKGRV